MLITINNKVGRPAKQYLEANRRKFPPFQFTRDVVYNGVVIEADEDNEEDLVEALDVSGFDWTAEDAEPSRMRTEKSAPKLPKAKPVLSKNVPKLPKTVKVRPYIPR